MYLHLEPHVMDDTLATLSALAELSSQSEAGFRACAEQARADDVRALLRRRAEECKAATAELQAHVRRLGGGHAGPGQPGPQSWTVVRATLTAYGDLALLEECERGEDALLERYTDALTHPLEPATRDMVESQRLETRRQHELLRAMRDRLRGLG